MNNNEVKFEESKFGSYQSFGEKKKLSFQDKLLNIIIKLSGGKLNEKQAMYVLFALIALAFVACFMLLTGGGTETGIENLPAPPAE